MEIQSLLVPNLLKTSISCILNFVKDKLDPRRFLKIVYKTQDWCVIFVCIRHLRLSTINKCSEINEFQSESCKSDHKISMLIWRTTTYKLSPTLLIYFFIYLAIDLACVSANIQAWGAWAWWGSRTKKTISGPSSLIPFKFKITYQF